MMGMGTEIPEYCKRSYEDILRAETDGTPESSQRQSQSPRLLNAHRINDHKNQMIAESGQYVFTGAVLGSFALATYFWKKNDPSYDSSYKPVIIGVSAISLTHFLKAIDRRFYKPYRIDTTQHMTSYGSGFFYYLFDCARGNRHKYNKCRLFLLELGFPFALFYF